MTHPATVLFHEGSRRSHYKLLPFPNCVFVRSVPPLLRFVLSAPEEEYTDLHHGKLIHMFTTDTSAPRSSCATQYAYLRKAKSHLQLQQGTPACSMAFSGCCSGTLVVVQPLLRGSALSKCGHAAHCGLCNIEVS